MGLKNKQVIGKDTPNGNSGVIQQMMSWYFLTSPYAIKILIFYSHLDIAITQVLVSWLCDVIYGCPLSSTNF